MSILTRFTSVYFWMFIQMMKGIIIILVINHYVSIGWLVLGVYYTDPGQTWVAQSELLSASFAEQYVSSFHWSLAQFLPSTTNIAPVHGLERLYAVLAVLLALSSFITGVTNTVNALRAVRVSSLTQEAKLRQFFVERRLPARLLKLCLSAYHEKAEKASMSEQDVAILQSSPERLRAQLHQEMFRGVLTNRCWVRVALRDESTGLLMKICHLAMVERATMKSEDVFLEGTDCFGAVILTHGCMTYSTDHIKVARTSSTSLRGKPPTPLMFEEVSEGQWLCEIALWVHWWHRGQLSAQGVALYAFVDGLKLARLATETGGFVYTYLRTFGILLTSFMEEMMFNFQGTDLSIEEDGHDCPVGPRTALPAAVPRHRGHDHRFRGQRGAGSPTQVVRKPVNMAEGRHRTVRRAVPKNSGHRF
ncbi:unnamed protein product [Effrenium voratum]|nr:unnamed protein product [Effrenium voratum]